MKSGLESRLMFLLVLFTASFVLLGTRLFYLQVIQGENLRTVAEANRTQIVFERAPRGLILDRNGAVLADSRPTFVVIFTPLELKKEVLSGIVHRLSGILGLSEDELRKKLQPSIRHSSIVRLMDRASRHIAFTLAEQKPNLPGVSVVIEMQRRYPGLAMASHVVGYLSQVSEEEIGEGYKPNALVGKMGLEKNYDQVLRGEDGGMRLEVNASGQSVKILDRKEPSVGYELRTTLDLKIQGAAEEALKETQKAGAVVALDPRTGAILAMASAPSFDPNIFVYTRGERTEDNSTPGDLVMDPERPLYNRAIQGLYPPGSIFKIVDTAVGYETKKLNPFETVRCPGYYILEGRDSKKFLCWKKEGHGIVNLTDGLVNSCNVYFYTAGRKLGPDLIEDTAKQFGLGVKTGIELDGEMARAIPGRGMFKTEERRHWYDGDTLNLAIGQGKVLFTPIQAAQMIGVVATRGKIFRPHLVEEIRYPTGEVYKKTKTELVKQISMSKETWDFLDSALKQVVERGTGQSCQIPGISVGGKTGTAQNPHGKDHAWFVCFAPVENPEIAVAVLVEHGQHGATSAAPIARKVLLAALSPEAVKKQGESQAPQAPQAFSGD